MILPFGTNPPGTTLTGTGLARNGGACTELSGDVTTSGSNATALKATGTAGTYTKVTTDAAGRVSSGTTLATSDIPGAGGSAGDGAYIWSMDVDDASIISGGITISPVGANTVHVFKFVASKTITIRKCAFTKGSTNVNATTACFGIYDSSGSLVAAANGFDTSAGGATTQSQTFTGATLFAGNQYWFAQSSTNATVTSSFVAMNTGVQPMRGQNVTRQGTAANAMSGGALPSTLGVVTAFTNRAAVAVLFES